MADKEPKEAERETDLDLRGEIASAFAATKADAVLPDQVIPAKDVKPAKETKAAKEPKPSAPVQSEPATQELPESAPETGAEPAEEKPDGEKPDTLTAPKNWTQADKERFGELPKPAQEIVLERHKAMEADYTRKTMEIADLKKNYSVVDEMFAPYKLQLQQRGQTPASIIQGWAAAEQALANPATREAAFKNIAQAYQVDLAKLAGSTVQPQAAPLDPANMTEQQQLDALLQPMFQQALTPYQREIEALKAQVAQAQQFQSGSVQAQRQQIVHGTINEVQNFAAAKDATGNLLHPYFSDVENDMAALMAGYHQQGRQLNLDEAYQLAVRANPSTFERLSAQQKKAADEQRAQEARAKAAQANRAGSSVRGGPSNGQPFTHAQGNGQDLSLRDELMASLHASQGRV